jgi:exopolyphosphatase/guanosine-5'-triphosphate,3'-diphosphate pyrophosphatase
LAKPHFPNEQAALKVLYLVIRNPIANRTNVTERTNDRAGATALVRSVAQAKAAATPAGCDELLAFATSAVRDAENAAAVLARMDAETGIGLEVMSGEDEARYTFLAVRRWYGWSAGRLLVLDIGGGSLEIAAGRDEDPDVAMSLPLGAAAHLAAVRRRPTRPRRRRRAGPRAGRRPRAGGPAGAQGGAVRGSGRHVEDVPFAGPAAGAAPSSAGLRTRRALTDVGLRQLFAFISRMGSPDLAALEGVSAGRAHQLVAGALVAAAAMQALQITELQICPWALREGVILRRLDTLGVPTRSERPWPLTDHDPHRGDDSAQHRGRSVRLDGDPDPQLRMCLMDLGLIEEFQKDILATLPLTDAARSAFARGAGALRRGRPGTHRGQDRRRGRRPVLLP